MSWPDRLPTGLGFVPIERAWPNYLYMGFPLIVAACVQLAVGQEVQLHENFYVVVATVIPVLLLALMVELATAAPIGNFSDRFARIENDVETTSELVRDLEPRATTAPVDLEVLNRLRDIESDLRKGLRETQQTQRAVISMGGRLRDAVRCFFAHAAMGVGAALYALAAHTSSTFLVVVCILALAMLTGELWFIYELRFQGPRQTLGDPNGPIGRDEWRSVLRPVASHTDPSAGDMPGDGVIGTARGAQR